MNEIEIDKSIVNNLVRKIVRLEQDNLKSKENSNTQMIEKIKEIIKEKLECNSNQ